ncbi:unnamed protein product, partial [Amoebophrya sp. A25]
DSDYSSSAYSYKGAPAGAVRKRNTRLRVSGLCCVAPYRERPAFSAGHRAVRGVLQSA